jgi:hypothetical protein
MACPGRPVLVSLPDWPATPAALDICPTITTLSPASSWEFATTLDFEWSAIRRRQPYRWTIWVRDDAHLLSGFVFRTRAVALPAPSSRSTPLRAFLSHGRDYLPGGP